MIGICQEAVLLPTTLANKMKYSGHLHLHPYSFYANLQNLLLRTILEIWFTVSFALVRK